MVRKWVRAFKDGRKNVHDEERSGRPSVISDDLLQKVEENVKMIRPFTFSSLSEEIPQVSRMKLLPNPLQWLSYQAAKSMTKARKTLLFDMISALILEEIMWKSRLKCELSCKNKIVTIFLLVFL